MTALPGTHAGAHRRTFGQRVGFGVAAMLATRPTMPSRKGPNVLISRRVATAASTVASTAALAVALAGCDTDQVGAAAVVGDERITVNELQDQVREVVALGTGGEPTGDQREAQVSVLNQMIAFTLLDRVEADTGIEVTGAEIDTFVEETLVAGLPDGDLTPLLVQNWLTEETLRDAVRQELVMQQLGGPEAYFAAVAAASGDLGVTVNSRYGAWDGVVITPASGSISVPVGGDLDEFADLDGHDH